MKTSVQVLASVLALGASVSAHDHGDHGDHGDKTSSLVPTYTTASVPTEPPSHSPPPQEGCPTVTETRELCSTCIVPACLEMSTVTQSCGCPEAVPTVYLDFPCEAENNCAGAGCSTTYDIVQAEEMKTCPPGKPSESEPQPTETGVPTDPTFSMPTVKPPYPSGNATTPSPSSPAPPTGTDEPPVTVSDNAAGRMAIPFMGWF